MSTKFKSTAATLFRGLILSLAMFIVSSGFNSCRADGTDVPIVNPTFTFTDKAGLPDGWLAFPGGGAINKIEPDPAGNGVGVHLVDTDANSGLGVAQWVPATAGHKYVLTADAKGAGGLFLQMLFLPEKPRTAGEISKNKLAEARQWFADSPDFKPGVLEATAPAGSGVIFVWIYSTKQANNVDVVVKSIKLQDLGDGGAAPAPAPAKTTSTAAPSTPAPAAAAPWVTDDNIGQPKGAPLNGQVSGLPKGIIQVVDFETGDISQASYNEGGRKSMSTDIVRQGKYAIRVALVKDQKRSEISTQRVEPYGEFKYGWSIYIPNDFDAKTVFTIVSQWHTYGSGKDYKPDGGPPTSIAMDGDAWSLKVQYQDKDTDNSAHVYIPFGSIQDDRGKWTDFVMEANWQSPQTGGGYIRLYKNGAKVVDYVGPTWFDGKTAGPNFKVGMYRGISHWPGDEAKSILYFDDLRVGGAQSTIKDVDPAQQPDSISPVKKSAPTAEKIPAQSVAKEKT